MAHFITDIKMLQLIENLKADGKIIYTQEFCDAMDFHKQNIRNVRNGSQHFTPEHIAMICDRFNVNANYLIGLEDNIYRLPASKKTKTTINIKSNKKAKKPTILKPVKKSKSMLARV